MNFIKAHWKLLLVAVGVVVLIYSVGSVTGTNNKLYGMLVDELTKDKDEIVKRQEEFIKDCEEEITRLSEQKVITDAEIAKREVIISDLKKQISDLTVSSDPGELVNDLLRYGIRVRIRIRN